MRTVEIFAGGGERFKYMLIRFTKMQGAGNDYIYVNCMKSDFLPEPGRVSTALSDRHFGVGGDGLVLLCASQTADARMRMFNADGSEGKMCGNAIRCVAKYLYDNKIIDKTEMDIQTASGVKRVRLFVRNGEAVSARVDMGKAELLPAAIPVNLGGDAVISRPHSFGGKEYAITCVSMGNPHCVVFCPDVQSLRLAEIGPAFENDAIFPERVNTEFVKVPGKNALEMRVWERGSGETLACGTGACAAAAAAVLNGYCDKGADISVKLTGGTLVISYTDGGVYMTGPCVKVFDGEIEI
jgi:carbamoyl-phosphate synthase large subunit